MDPLIIQVNIDVFAYQTIRISWSIEDYSGIRSAELVIWGPNSIYFSIEPNGAIKIHLKPGNYPLFIIARDPYEHVAAISRTFELYPIRIEITSPAMAPDGIAFPVHLVIGVVLVTATVLILVFYVRRAKT